MSSSIKISYLGKTKYVPQNWSQLSKRQFLDIFKTFSNRIILEEQKLLHIKSLIDIKWKHYKKLNEDQLIDLLPITDFLYSEEEVLLEKNPLPCFKLRGVTYHGVDIELENMTIGDYGRLDVCIDEYIKTKKLSYIYELAAILYRPKTIRRRIKNLLSEKTIDERKLISEKSLERRKKLFQKYLPLHFIDAIKFIYLSIQNKLKQQFQYVYRKPDDSEITNMSDYGWSAIIIDMAGNKFGTISETYNQPLTDILTVLNRDLELEELRETRK